MHPEALAGILQSLVREGAAGNVTVPYKGTVAHSCHRLTSLAERVGAVNTFWVEDGQLIGDNTDVGGFSAAVPRCRHVAVLGAGGSAAAILTAVSEWPGVDVRLWNRSPERAVVLAERFGARPVGTKEEAVAHAALVVNATSVGLDGVSQPIDVAQLPQGAEVFDLVYSPNETPWVRAARAAGHRAQDGLAMLIEQGALAFERWFGRAPDRTAMWRAAAPDRNRFIAEPLGGSGGLIPPKPPGAPD